MTDTIHGKKKIWPHFDTIYLSSDAYSEGYDRIFRSKNEKDNETRRGRKIQKVSRKAKAKRGKKP
jgi:hypothetical protein